MVATLAVAGVSIGLAALVSFRLLAGTMQGMVSFSIGVLLGTTFLHLLPEAFEEAAGQVELHVSVLGNSVASVQQALFALILAGLLGFFILEKIALYRHSHHFEGDGHHHEHGHDAREAGHGGALVLIGSAFHNFADGVLIAGAFLAGPWIGFAATLSIMSHEIPHKISDFIVLRHAGLTQNRAIRYASASSACVIIGGLAGYFLLAELHDFLPAVLVLAASSFLYISLSDLVPQAHREHLEKRGVMWALLQTALIGGGIMLVSLINAWAHQYGG